MFLSRKCRFPDFVVYVFVEVLKRRGKPNCLLVYSPTRLTHINAMVELAKYLRNCNVAVVDTIDVADSAENVSRSGNHLSVDDDSSFMISRFCLDIGS